ncbi:MAG: BolA family protein [Acidobacteriota bacterium]|nr:BolA family protein [Acidobacteriota bacterium]
MSVQAAIEAKLSSSLAPSHLEVINESHMHSVAPGSESHFRVRVVSETFAGKRLVARHRAVNQLLNDELAGPIHALALETLTEEEWVARGGVGRESPDCQGGDGGSHA